VLEQAEALAKGGRRLLIVGHSDTPGSAATNRRIAGERARAVASALVARGIAPASLETGSAGEEQLLVPTAEGVREVQNRRVTIRAVAP
jgi:outer membrane protein OmpA-like peptidoglycan-associated protein